MKQNAEDNHSTDTHYERKPDVDGMGHRPKDMRKSLNTTTNVPQFPIGQETLGIFRCISSSAWDSSSYPSSSCLKTMPPALKLHPL